MHVSGLPLPWLLVFCWQQASCACTGCADGARNPVHVAQGCRQTMVFGADSTGRTALPVMAGGLSHLSLDLSPGRVVPALLAARTLVHA